MSSNQLFRLDVLMAIERANINAEQFVAVIVTVFVEPEKLRVLSARRDGIKRKLKRFISALHLRVGLLVALFFTARRRNASRLRVLDAFDSVRHGSILGELINQLILNVTNISGDLNETPLIIVVLVSDGIDRRKPAVLDIPFLFRLVFVHPRNLDN